MPTKKNTAQPISLHEVVDKHDTPLALMQLKSILRQKLAYRFIALALFTKDSRLCLHKREVFPKRSKKNYWWGLYTAACIAGESREDTAIRLGTTAAGDLAITVAYKDHFTLPAWHPFYGTLYQGYLPRGIFPQQTANLIIVDNEELTGFMQAYPESIAPELSWSEKTGNLFPIY